MSGKRNYRKKAAEQDDDDEPVALNSNSKRWWEQGRENLMKEERLDWTGGEERRHQPPKFVREPSEDPDPTRDAAPRKSEKPPCRKLFIGGLSYTTDDAGLKEHFASVGKVVSARVMLDRDTNQSRGFGFVEYAEQDDADKAFQELYQSCLDDRTLHVDYAAERAPRPRSPDRRPRRDEPERHEMHNPERPSSNRQPSPRSKRRRSRSRSRSTSPHKKRRKSRSPSSSSDSSGDSDSDVDPEALGSEMLAFMESRGLGDGVKRRAVLADPKPKEKKVYKKDGCHVCGGTGHLARGCPMNSKLQMAAAHR